MSTLFDTHMSDYPADIDMHHAAEPWFDAEARMDDDLPLKNNFPDHGSTHSVEVDMDDHYVQDEYEMDGGEEIYEEMSSDLLDIEVYDVSEPLEDASLPAAEQVNAQDSQAFEIDSEEIEKIPLLPSEPLAIPPLPLADTELPDAVASALPGEEEVAEEEEEVQVARGDFADEEHDAQATEGEEGVAAELVVPHLDASIEASPQFHSDEPGDEKEQSGAHVPDLEERVESVDALPDSRDVEEPKAEESASLDPHEISEGVYIDPPPAVLVSFESLDCSDICLFNLPTRSRSPTPSTERHGPGDQVFELLLHHQPILYYEPLLSVFEALRHEEYLARIPQFADSELVLDAYDLQLVISEDNIYAREVSLHDLNVLHDGSEHSGPLRLRLNTVSPRFILRYRLLQDQIAQLNVASGEQRPLEDTTEPHQDQDQSDAKDKDSQLAAAQEAPESKSTSLSTPKIVSSSTQDGGHETLQEEPQLLDASENIQQPENGSQAAEDEPQAEEPGEQRETGEGGESYGEKSEHNEVDDPEAEASTYVPDEGENDEAVEEAEEFAVVEASAPEPEAPLTGAASARDTGNAPEKTPNSQSPSSFEHHSEPGPSKPKATNIDQEPVIAAVADDSADPSSYNDAEEYEGEETRWEEAVEDEQDPDATWEAEVEQETASNQSSVTLSSKASKRSFDEVEPEEDESRSSPPSSPGAKRSRVD